MKTQSSDGSPLATSTPQKSAAVRSSASILNISDQSKQMSMVQFSSVDEDSPLLVSAGTQTDYHDCTHETARAIHDELTSLSKNAASSKLGCTSTLLETLTLDDFETEFKTKTPTLYKTLYVGVNRNSKKALPDKKHRGLLTVLCKVVNIYNQKLNAYQKLYGLSLRSSGTSKKMINQASSLYDCVSYTTLTNILDCFAEQSKEMLRCWNTETVIHCGDNLDFRSSKRHESSGCSYHQVHLYNNMLYKSRIHVEHLSSAQPQVYPEDIDYSTFLLDEAEEDTLLQNMAYHIKASWQVMVSKSIRAEQPNHTYSEEAKCVTEKLHVGVIEKNQSSTGEMLDILVHCKQFPTPSHANKVPYRGDVGTYRTAKKALSIADPSEKLPFIPCIGGFHLQMEWVQVIFDLFYDELGARDAEGLAAMRTVLNCKQVTKDIRKNYYAADLFLNKVLDAMLLEAAHNKFGMDALNDHPILADETVNDEVQHLLQDIFSHSRELPSNRCPVCSRQYKDLNRLRTHIVAKHADAYPLEGETSDQVDSTSLHTRQLMKVLLLKRCLDYSIKSANGRVLSLLMKHMMLYFHNFSYKNYALACFEHTALVQVLLSERDRALIEQECFVNNKGRAMTNLPMDLDVEHSNRFFKDHFSLKDNAPSQPVLQRLSLSQDMLEKVLTHFWIEFGMFKHTPVRSIDDDSYQSDVKKLQEHLSPLKIFGHKPGRKLHSSQLQKGCHDPLLLLNMYKLKQWLEKSYNRLCDQRFLDS